MIKILAQTSQQIQYLYHLSDIHIRNHSRHQEYRHVFNKTYQLLNGEVKNNPPASGLIVITGDIVHSKSQISPQLIIELRDFLTSLCQIMPVIMIAGNHDLNLSNKNVPDTLTSILHKIEIPNLYYLKNSGIYQWNNIQFSVMSVLDYPLIRATEFPKNNQPILKIGLLHATLHGSKIATSQLPLTSDKYKASDFDGYDAVLLGDIHLHQYMNQAKTIAYAGSLIQQSFGEELKGHGFLKWDLINKTSKLIEIENDWGFVNLHIKNNQIGPQKMLIDLPENLNLKIRFLDDSNINLTNDYINNLVKEGFNVLSNVIIPYTPNLEHPMDALPEINGSNQEVNLMNHDYQKSLMDEYLGSEFEYLDRIHDLHDSIVKQHQNQIEINNHSWKLLSMEFQNTFSYTGLNYIDFTQFKGIIGIIGPNFSGKSNIMDIILFGLFDKASRGERTDIMTANQNELSIKINFRVGHTKYTIHRTGKATFNKEGDKKVKIDVRFYTDHEDLTGETRHQTNKNICNLIGNYDDFVLTTLKLQNPGLGNLISLTNSQRKERLVDLLRLNVLDDYAKIAGSQLRDQKKELDLYQQELKMLPPDLSESLEKILDQLINQKTEINLLKLQWQSINTNLKEKNSLLIPVNMDLVNQEYQDIPQIDISQIKKMDQELNQLNQELSDYKCRLKPLFYGMSREELVDNINLYAETIQEQKDKLQVAEELEKENQVLIKALLGNKSNFQKKLVNYGTVVSQCARLKEWIQRCLDNNEKLLNLEYDQDCQYCMNNVFVKDAIQCRDDLQKNQEKLSDLESELNEMESIRQELDQVEKEIEVLQKDLSQNDIIKMKSELKQWKDELSNLKEDRKKIDENRYNQEKIDIVQKKINQKQNDRDQLWELWEKYTLMIKVKEEKEKEQSNHDLRQEILELEQESKKVLFEIDQLDQQIRQLSSQEQMMEHQINRYRQLTQKIKKLQVNNTILDIYVKCLGKDGIPKYLIGKYLPEFERVVNLIMEDLVNFRIKMEISDKKWNLYVVYKDRKLNLDLCSGYEKFVVGLAIKCALFHLSQMSKPNFMVIDEGFGSLDQQHLGEIGRILNYLRGKYDFVLLITHIEAIKDELDNQIEIKKDGDYSKVNNRSNRKMSVNFRKKSRSRDQDESEQDSEFD